MCMLCECVSVCAHVPRIMHVKGKYINNYITHNNFNTTLP